MSFCRNDCDFSFEGFDNDTVPVFNLAAAAEGAIPARLSPRIVYGGRKAVQVDASGPGAVVRFVNVKRTVERVRRLAQFERETEIPDGFNVAERTSEPVSSNLLLGASKPITRRTSRVDPEFTLFASSSGERGPAYVYQHLDEVDKVRGLRRRCIKLPLVKLRVYYWGRKFVYVTEGDGNSYFPEARRCVVFRTI